LAVIVVVETKIEEVYSLLIEIATQKKAAIIFEETPSTIIVKQGSLWGISPKTAKKTVKFHLSQNDFGTMITSRSDFSSDYIWLTGVGCILASVLAVFLGWLSLDLTSFASSQQPSSWSWIVSFGSYVNTQGAVVLRDLSLVFTVFLIVTLALETSVVFYVKRRIGNFAEDILKTVSQSRKEIK